MNRLRSFNVYEKVSPSFVMDIFKQYSIESVYDPFCGTGLFLNYFKRHKINDNSIRVIGNDLTSFGFMASKALNENNNVILSEKIIEKFINIERHGYSSVSFEKWTRMYKFSPKQVKLVEYWRDAIEEVPFHTAGLIMVVLFWLLNYWLNSQKFKEPEIFPHEVPYDWQHILKDYFFKVNCLVHDNFLDNKVFHEDVMLINPFVEADAAFVNFPDQTGYYKENLSLCLCEAWWQRTPDLNMPDFYKNRSFQKGETCEQYIGTVKKLMDSLSAIKTLAVFYHPNPELDIILLKELISRVRKIQKIVAVGPSMSKQVEKSYIFIAR